jgi:hypothetical protein
LECTSALLRGPGGKILTTYFKILMMFAYD